MFFSKSLISLAALASYTSAVSVSDEAQYTKNCYDNYPHEVSTYPWSGRFQTLDGTYPGLEKIYQTYIMCDRNALFTGTLADQIQIDQHARTPAFNGDTGVMTAVLLPTGIFQQQVQHMRRTEVIQVLKNVNKIPEGVSFTGSFRRTSDLTNSHFGQYEIYFLESKGFSVQIHASDSGHKFVVCFGGVSNKVFEHEMDINVYQNFE
eukprot:Pgem_evm1s16720